MAFTTESPPALSHQSSSCWILEGCVVISIEILRPFWRPLPLVRARHSLASFRKHVWAGGQDDGDCSDPGPAKSAEAAAALSENPSDLGGRYLDFIAQAMAQGRGRVAASNGALPPHRGPPVRGRRGGYSRPETFVDASVYDAVVLTTDWEPDGYVAACVVFAVFTAEARRARAADGGDGDGKPYPLRTVIVGEGDPSEKACRVREALAAMREAGVVPPGCRIDVLEGAATANPPSGEGKASPTNIRTRYAGRGAEVEEEREGGWFWGSFLGLYAVVLRGAAKVLPGRGWWRWMGRRRKKEPYIARNRLRDLLADARRQRQRVLVIALKPPRDLTEVLLESNKAGWWGRGRGREGRWGGGDRGERSEFDHVDLLISGVFSGVFGGMGEGEKKGLCQPRSTSRGHDAGDEVMTEGDLQEVMSKVNSVFVVQLHDLLGSYDFPTAISPDRTPVLAAAVAGARGGLSSTLRRMVAASNERELTGFPDKVAAAISARRYANEELRSGAAVIAAAVTASAAEPGASRARLAKLGSRMANLIATDFEALDRAGLSPGIHQAVFRSLDVRVNLSSVAVAWALACPEAVSWEHFHFVSLDASSGLVVPQMILSGESRRGFRGRDTAGSYEGEGDGDGARSSPCRVAQARGCYKKSSMRVCNSDSVFRERDGGDAEVVGMAVSATFATGFARWFERLEDQEAGYADFAGFLVRVLDQMP